MGGHFGGVCGASSVRGCLQPLCDGTVRWTAGQVAEAKYVQPGQDDQSPCYVCRATTPEYARAAALAGEAEKRRWQGAGLDLRVLLAASRRRADLRGRCYGLSEERKGCQGPVARMVAGARARGACECQEESRGESSISEILEAGGRSRQGRNTCRGLQFIHSAARCCGSWQCC